MAHNKRLCRLHTRENQGDNRSGNFHTEAAYLKARKAWRQKKQARRTQRLRKG